MSKHTGELMLRGKAGADVEISIQQFDHAKLLAAFGVGRDELPAKRPLSQRLDIVSEFAVTTRMPIGVGYVLSDREPSMNNPFHSVL